MPRSRTSIVCPRTLLALAAAMLLTACGSGPSETDIDQVVKKTVAAEKAAAERLMSGTGAMLPQIHAVKKLGCKETSSNVYSCDVEIEASSAGGARTKTPTKMRFAKGSDGWAPMR